MITQAMRMLKDAMRGERGSASMGPITLGMRADPRKRDALRDTDDGEMLTPGGFADKYWAELLAIAIGVGVLAYLAYLYTRFALPPGTDAGQWLAVSRFYLGEHVPAGRSVATVPPVVPVALAAISVVTGAPGAIVTMSMVMYAGICAVAFALGSRITGSATGGLLAVVAIAVVQSRLFEFFAMGAFPQLSALIGMSICLYALLGLSKHPDEQREWLTLAAGTALTLFSHTPSSTVLIPVLALTLAYLAWSSDDRRALATQAAKTLGPVFAAWAVFVIINRDVIFGYANVPAAFELKGPDKLFRIIWRDNVQRIVFGAGIVALITMVMTEKDGAGDRWKSRPSVVLCVWTATLAMLIVYAAARQTGTDYPRFAVYFVVPLGLAVAAGVHSFDLSRGAIIAMLLPVLMFAGYDGLQHFDTATRFYGMNERADDLKGVSAWLNDDAEEGGVIGGTRETKWMEALTGRDTLLYLPRIYITRPWEIERAIDAEVVHRSNGGIETGRMLITSNDGGQDFGKVFPPGVRVDTFSQGLYVPTFTMRNNTTAVTFESLGSTRKLSLASMDIVATHAWHDDAGEHIATTFTSPDVPVAIVRVVTAENADLDAFTVDLFVGAPAGVRVDSLLVGTGDAGPIEVKPATTTYVYPELGDGSAIEVEAKTSWLANAAPPQDANPYLEWRRARVQMDVGDGDRRIPYTRLIDPGALLQREGIRYIIDRNGDGASFPIIRQRALAPVYQNGEYSVYDVGQ